LESFCCIICSKLNKSVIQSLSSLLASIAYCSLDIIGRRNACESIHKLDCACGSGPAPAAVTEKIFALSKSLAEYHTCPDLHVDIATVGSHHFTINGIGEFDVQIVDTTQDYAELMREIFDFAAIRSLLTGASGQPKLNILVNALHGGQQYSTSEFVHTCCICF